MSLASAASYVLEHPTDALLYAVANPALGLSSAVVIGVLVWSTASVLNCGGAGARAGADARRNKYAVAVGGSVQKTAEPKRKSPSTSASPASTPHRSKPSVDEASPAPARAPVSSGGSSPHARQAAAASASRPVPSKPAASGAGTPAMPPSIKRAGKTPAAAAAPAPASVPVGRFRGLPGVNASSTSGDPSTDAAIEEAMGVDPDAGWKVVATKHAKTKDQAGSKAAQ